MPLLEVAEVSVRFGGHMALQDVSLQIDQSRITGLIGPNGAGKTTLFNVITGLQVPLRGSVRLNGIDITGFPPHHRSQRGIARTFQRLELFGSLTARENLMVAAEIPRSWGGSNTRSADQRVAETIEVLGLGAFADTRSDVLTTGQARLVELGRAVITGPKVLLLDEPASGLDADETEELAGILADLATTGVGILLVEHDMPLVMRACHQLYVLNFGSLLASGPPAQIQHDPAVIKAYLGTPVGAEP